MSGVFAKLDEALSKYPPLRLIFSLLTLGLGILLFVICKSYVYVPEVNVNLNGVENFDEDDACDECEKETGDCCGVPNITTNDPNVSIVMAATPIGANALATKIINDQSTCTTSNGGTQSCSTVISQVQDLPPMSVAPFVQSQSFGTTTYTFSCDGTQSANKTSNTIFTKDAGAAYTVFDKFCPSSGIYEGDAITNNVKGAWFQMSLNQKIIVTGYRFSFEVPALQWTLMGSDDSTTWAVLHEVDLSMWTNGKTPTTFTFANNTPFTIFRFVMRRSDKSPIVSISQFTFVGVPM